MFFLSTPSVIWPIPVQKDNRVRNPNPKNFSIIQCTERNRIDWAISHNEPTFIKFCWVRIINSLLRSERERLQHENEVIRNRCKQTSILRENDVVLTKGNVRFDWENWGESLRDWEKGGMKNRDFETI
jgi:hypothetical protein